MSNEKVTPLNQSKHYSAINVKLVIVMLISLASLGSFSDQSRADTVEVVGYSFDLPSLEGSTVPNWVGNDPVVGRLACPPLTRLNIQSKKSEPVMLKSAHVQANGPSRKWILDPRTDLHWWSGAQVTKEDFKSFIQNHLSEVVRSKGIGLWPVPTYKVEAAGSGPIVVTWDHAPVFGPFLFNGIPLSRRTAKVGSLPTWECVGLYQVEVPAPNRLRLTPSRYYSGNRSTLEFVAAQEGRATRRLTFEMAKSQTPERITQKTTAMTSCEVPLDLPLATIISWNSVSGPASNAEVRKALTQLTPRGELVRSGAASMGEVLSAPIVRAHPGYDRKLSARPYSLEQASAILDANGFKRKKADEPRLDKNGVPMKLVLQAPGSSNPLLQKVLIDAFSLAGIGLEFTDGTKVNKGEKTEREIDGIISGVSIPVPENDFIANFHSLAPGAGLFWPLKNKSLDSALEAYALSLTSEVPDFKQLQHVHRILYEVEPVTVLMQHRACLSKAGAGWPSYSKLDSRDPDWFRKLVL